MYSVSDCPRERTISVRLSGSVTQDELQRVVFTYTLLTDSYRRGSHLVFVDIRGLRSPSTAVTETLHELITYARDHGVFRFVRLTDASMQRLRAAGVTRAVATDQDSTLEVDSPAEAFQVLRELREMLHARARAQAA